MADKVKNQMRLAAPFVCPCREDPTEPATPTPNVIAVRLGETAESEHATVAMTGDPALCSNPNCGAAFSKSDASRTKRDPATGDIDWVCPYCANSTRVRLDSAEMPSSNSVDYVTQPAAVDSAGAVDDSSVLFVVDSSGSMCVSCEVPQPKGAKPKFVSRLACVQKAITSQIAEMAKRQPKRRAALVTFGDDVTVIGDGTEPPEVVAGEKLLQWDALVAVGNSRKLDVPVEKTATSLTRSVANLEENGSTALGPALLVAVSMAAKRRGSKVVVCTDGLANCGIGGIEGLGTPELIAAASEFYSKVGALAKESGVVVSVVSIKGTACSLENLGKVSDATGGDVDMVDPLNVSFSDALKPIQATAVRVKVFVHPTMALAGNVRVKAEDVGNVDEGSEITFGAYTVDASPAAAPSEVPFQCQISYTKLDGSRHLRVLTCTVPFTADAESVYRDLSILTVGLHVSKTSARLVQDGKYAAARKYAHGHEAMLTKAATTPEKRAHLAMFHRQLSEGVGALDVAEREELLNGVDLGEDSSSSFRRSAARSDHTAEIMYHYKGKQAAACLVM